MPITFHGALARGAVFMFLVAASAHGQAEIRHAFTGSTPGDEFGSILDGVGDVDGDGRTDVIVGAPGDSGIGAAKVYSGATGAVLFSMTGPQPGSGFGFGANTAGDVNNDGVNDFIVGMPGNGTSGSGPGGGARIYSGATGAILRTHAGAILNDAFGTYLAALGDINDDGYDDVLIGTAIAIGLATPGYANVYSGIDGSILYAKTGSFNGHRYGLAYRAGDLTGDSVSEFIVAALGGNVNGAASGSVFVYDGSTGAQIHAFHGLSAGDRLGYSASGVGDVNGDGFGDVIVGTYKPTAIGYARVYSGSTGAVLHHLTDGVTGDAFGHTVAGVGDVNGDGTSDYAVAAPNSNINGATSGFVRVYSGATGSVIRDFIGSAAGVRLGYAINPAGDVNGDGLPDIALGALISGAAPGQALVVSVCAAAPYGAGLLPTQTLSLAWNHGASGHEAEGAVAVVGAAAGASGLIAANLLPASLTLFSVPVLIDPSPGMLAFDLVYGGAGDFSAPLNLRAPSLSGVSLYAQAFELSAGAPEGVFASNALALHFGN